VHIRDELVAVCDDVHEHHVNTASIPGICVTVAEDGLANDLSRDELILLIDSLVGNCLPLYKKNRQLIRPFCITILYHNLLLFIDIFRI
jgi:hypothetical protein